MASSHKPFPQHFQINRIYSYRYRQGVMMGVSRQHQNQSINQKQTFLCPIKNKCSRYLIVYYSATMNIYLNVIYIYKLLKFFKSYTKSYKNKKLFWRLADFGRYVKGVVVCKSAKKGKFVTKIFLSNNVEWSSKNLWKMVASYIYSYHSTQMSYHSAQCDEGHSKITSWLEAYCLCRVLAYRILNLISNVPVESSYKSPYVA